MIRGLIKNSFGFKDADIVELTEAEGKTRGDAGLPTRANIEKAFAELAKKAKDGDQVFIAMGGHGTQAPAKPDDVEEEDGLDEVFLPRDVGKWDDSTGEVKNGIIDNDLEKWLDAIRDKGAHVCIVLDACHSGTMTRGDGKEVQRGMESKDEGGIEVPEAAIKKAIKLAADREAKKPEKSRGAEQPKTALKLSSKKPEKGGLVAIAAAQPSEPEVEREMPPRTDGNPVYGMLSYTMTQILTEAAQNGKAGITYRELTNRILIQYGAWGRTSPTPMVEGDLTDAPFLGGKNDVKPPALLLTKGDAGFAINGGTLHGITVESVYAVLTPPGGMDKILGYVKVANVRLPSCDVTPVEYNGMKAVEDLPDGGRVKLVYKDYGDQRTKLSVDTGFDDGKPVGAGDAKPKPVPAELRDKIFAECRKLLLPRGRGGMGLLGGAAATAAGEEWSAPEVPVELVAGLAKASWLVRPLDDGRVVLVPGSSGSAKGDLAKNKAYGPYPIDGTLAGKLKTALSSISRVENLLNVALNEGEGDEQVKIQTSFFLRDPKDPKGKFTVVKAFQQGETGVTFRDKDRIVIEVKNVGKVDVDVTVLYVDAAKGIECMFPDKKKGEENRLRTTDVAPRRIQLTIDGSETIGAENIIVIAVPHKGDTFTDFSFLEQKSLEQLRDAEIKKGERGLGNPFQDLLKKAAFNAGSTRGAKRDSSDDATHTMKVMSWEVKSKK